jgi:uncharacterized protein with beta-barrel porin domain
MYMDLKEKVNVVKDGVESTLSKVFNSRSKEGAKGAVTGARIGLEVAALATIFGAVAASPAVLAAGAIVAGIGAGVVVYQKASKAVANTIEAG